MREDLQEDYLRMTIDSYNRTGDTDKAIERWNNLGESKDRVYGLVQVDPGYLNPADVQQFSALVQSATGAPIRPVTPTGGEEPSATSSLFLYGAIAVLVLMAE